MRKAYVVGVGMTKFDKPDKKIGDYPVWVKEAVEKALKDAKIDYSEVETAFAGYAYGDSGCGQRSLQEIGLTGIPIFNVNNLCATGSSALYLAKQFVEMGKCDCVLAIGFEKMETGSIKVKYTDRAFPVGNHTDAIFKLFPEDKNVPITPQMFGNAGIEYMRKYGVTDEHLAKIAYKNHKHSVNNPYAQFQVEYTLKQILDSSKIYGPLTRLECCPTSSGAAAALLVSEKFIKKHNLQSQAVEILGMEMVTDLPSTLGSNSCMNVVGFSVAKEATARLFQKAKKSIEDVQVIELHDCFATNELILYDALGLCPPGKAAEFIDRGDNTYGGKYVVNPSGGLISKGHPLGATGLAQCAELCWQLRGLAEKRQVAGVKLGLQHNVGVATAVVVALYQRGTFD